MFYLIFLRICYLLSLITLLINPKINSKGFYYVFGIDCLVFLFLSLKLRQNKFILFLLFCSISSLILEYFEFKNNYLKLLKISKSLRPLVVFQLIKSFVDKNEFNKQLSDVFEKIKNQLYNVTVFFLFTATFFSLLGVQLFNNPYQKCILASSKNSIYLKTDVLMIPDMYCYNQSSISNCPTGFKCKNFETYKNIEIDLLFNNIMNAFFTVYKAASQEEWSFMMYDTIDQFSFSFIPIIYYVCLIFFLAWLVKNLFIAVITQIFVEIRTSNSILNNFFFEDKKRLFNEPIDSSINEEKSFKYCLIKLFDSKTYNYFILSQILIEVLLFSFFSFKIAFMNTYYIQLIHSTIEFLLFFFFFIDVTLKIFCYGFKNFSETLLHKFEIVLLLAYMLNIMFHFVFSFSLKSSVFKLLRIIRLVQLSPLFENFIFKIFSPARKLFIIIFFVILVLIILSLISFQLFCDSGSDYFSSFLNSFFSIFQILTQEGWIRLLDDVKSKVNNPFILFFISIFFIILHLFLTLVVLSLFLAVVLDNLEEEEDKKKFIQNQMRKEIEINFNNKDNKLPFRYQIFKYFKKKPVLFELNNTYDNFKTPEITERYMMEFCDKNFIKKSSIENYEYKIDFNLKDLKIMTEINRKKKNFISLIKQLSNEEIKNDDFLSKQIGILGDGWRESDRYRMENFKKQKNARRKSIVLDETNLKINDNEHQQRATSKALIALRSFLYKKSDSFVKDLEDNHPFFDTALLFFKKNNKFRLLCNKIINFKFEKYLIFKKFSENNQLSLIDLFMCFITFISCSFMFFEKPSNSVLNNSLFYFIEILFFICFFVELALKLIANGIFFTPKAYVKNIWSFIDIILLVDVFLLLIFIQIKHEKYFFLLILRSFKYLRFFSLVPNLRKVTTDLGKSFKEIVLVFVILIFFLFVFASFSFVFFGDKLVKCNDFSDNNGNCLGLTYKVIQGSLIKFNNSSSKFSNRIVVPRVRSNPRNFNFDNILSSMLALFEMLSIEGYTEVLDIFSKHLNIFSSLFIIFYIFLGIIVLNLFVGIVIENYNRNIGNALLTFDQRKWKDLKKRLKLVKPLKATKNIKNSRLFFLLSHQYFKLFMIITIILNSLLPIQFSLICFLIFFFETFLKIYFYSFSQYISISRLNILELFILIITVISYLVDYFFFNKPNISEYCSILRYLTLIGKISVLRMLVQTVKASFYKSFYIITTQVIFVFVYATIGVHLFSSVKFGESLSRHANFKTPLKSTLLLFRVMTGEDWNKIMHDCMISWPKCNSINCGCYFCSLIYFCSFYILITYITLNLLVAVIIENFSLFYSNDEYQLVSHNDIVYFQEKWLFVSRKHKDQKNLNFNQLKILLRLLDGKFKLDSTIHKLKFKCMLFEMKKLNKNFFSFHDVLNMLCYRFHDIQKYLEPDQAIEREDFEYLITEQVAQSTIQKWLENCIKTRNKNKREENISQSDIDLINKCKILEANNEKVSMLSKKTTESFDKKVDYISQIDKIKNSVVEAQEWFENNIESFN